MRCTIWAFGMHSGPVAAWGSLPRRGGSRSIRGRRRCTPIWVVAGRRPTICRRRVTAYRTAWYWLRADAGLIICPKRWRARATVAKPRSVIRRLAAGGPEYAPTYVALAGCSNTAEARPPVWCVAANCWRRILRRRCYNQMGVMCGEEGVPDLTVNVCRRAIALKPELGAVHIILGVAEQDWAARRGDWGFGGRLT